MKRLLCVLGAAAVGLSVCWPAARVPIVGDLDGVWHWSPTAYFLAGVVVLALGLAVSNAADWAWLPGCTALGVASYPLYQLCMQVRATTATLDTDVTGNPLSNLTTGLLQTLQLQWGIGVLLLGGMFLLWAALLPADASRRMTRGPPRGQYEDSEWGGWNAP